MRFQRVTQDPHNVSERDSKNIIRQWNREIEAELRSEAARERDSGPWRAVVWSALWCLWIALLFGVIAMVKSFR